MFDFRCSYSHELKIAVTGATGFIGRSLAATAHDFSPKNFEDLPDDSVVVHCAADISHGANQSVLVGNLDRDSWLFEQVNKRHRAVIYASGNNVYPKSLDCRIDQKYCFSDHYGASKVFGEMLLTEMSKKPFCILRIADVFGIGQRQGSMFKSVAKSLRKRSPLLQLGEGLKRRSYIYQPEIVGLMLHLAARMVRQETVPDIINSCYSDALSVKEIMQEMSKLSGLPIEIVPVNDDQSSKDIREMRPGPFGNYRFRWPSMRAALADYYQCAVTLTP